MQKTRLDKAVTAYLTLSQYNMLDNTKPCHPTLYIRYLSTAGGIAAITRGSQGGVSEHDARGCRCRHSSAPEQRSGCVGESSV